MVELMFDEMDVAIRIELLNADSVFVVWDGWDSKKRDSYLGVVLIWLDKTTFEVCITLVVLHVSL
jgi:hypothetical protein